MAGVPDEVTGLGLRLGDDLAGTLLRAGGAGQVHTDVAVDPRGVTGAVPAALRGAAHDVGGSDALGCPAEDLLGLGAVDRSGIGAGVLGFALVRVGRTTVGGFVAVGAAGGSGGCRLRGFRLRLGLRSSLGGDGLALNAERVGLLLGLLVLRIVTDRDGLVLEFDLLRVLGLGGDGCLVIGALSGGGHHSRGEQATAGSNDGCAAPEDTGVGVQKFSEFGQWSLDLGICGAAAMLLSCHVFPLVPIGFPGQPPLSVLEISQPAWRSVLAVKSPLRERPPQL